MTFQKVLLSFERPQFSTRNFEIQLRYSLFRESVHMHETIIVNVSHIVHHNGSTEKDQQITSRAEVGENRHESRCNSPINLVRIMSALDTVVNVQFPSIVLPSFRVRLSLLTQSLRSPPASACDERNFPTRRLAGDCLPHFP